MRKFRPSISRETTRKSLTQSISSQSSKRESGEYGDIDVVLKYLSLTKPNNFIIKFVPLYWGSGVVM